MSLLIQDPSYEKAMYLHETLLFECKDGIEGAGAYAFATKDGVKLLFEDDTFKKFLETGVYTLVVGTDDITNVNTLAELATLRDRYKGHLIVKAYVHNGKGSTFHPKFSWFKNASGGVLIIGSGNLTQKGLRHNREAYSVVNYNASEIAEVMKEWTQWYEHSEPFLFDVDDEKAVLKAQHNSKRSFLRYCEIKKDDGLIPEKEKELLNELYANQPPDNRKASKRISSERKQRKKTVSKIELDKNDPFSALDFDEDYDTDRAYWTFTGDSDVLIAEIPKSGNRWKQANFDKSSFENYFGATCGENGTYRILLRSIDSNGELGDVEIRPSVSVSSQNYRFELDAASGIPYPNGQDRPIAIFVRVSARDFLYELIMPEDKSYPFILNVLDEKKSRSNMMRRLTYYCNEIYSKIPTLGLWQMMENNENHG